MKGSIKKSLAGCSLLELISLLFPFVANADFPYLFYLLFPIVLSFVYSNKYLHIIILILTTIEIAVIMTLLGPSFHPIRNSQMVIHYSFLYLIVLLILLIVTVKLFPQMKQLLIEKELLSVNLSSKDGYLDLFFEHAQDAMAVFTLDYKIIVVNPAFEEMYGWKKDECVGKWIRLTPSTEDKGLPSAENFFYKERALKTCAQKDFVRTELNLKQKLQLRPSMIKIRKSSPSPLSYVTFQKGFKLSG